MKNAHKFIAIAAVLVLTIGTVAAFAVNSTSDLTGRLKVRESKQITKEEASQIRKETMSRKSAFGSQTKEKMLKEEMKKEEMKKEEMKKKESEKGSGSQERDNDSGDVLGNGVPPDATPVIETYIGSCNDPFGSPSCVVAGQYTTDDLTFNTDEIVYTMRVTNPSTITPIYMDKVFLEYDASGLAANIWGRTDWKIYDASAPNTVLTRGAVANAASLQGYVSFDWSYPGNVHNPINKPGVIAPGASQTYLITTTVADDAAGPNSSDYIQVRANDSFPFTPVIGGSLADAHSVNSHFIWHDANGNYYNEEYVDLMDMWGGYGNAYAQWRKRTWGGSMCGNGSIEPGEMCDDGNLTLGDGCNAVCEYEFCGDGYLDVDGADNIIGSPDDEMCDDGNNINGDGCDMTCNTESTVTLHIDNNVNPSDVLWTHSGVPDPWYIRTAMLLDITPSAPVTIPSYRMDVNFELITNGVTPVTYAQCANLSTMQAIANSKVTGFEMQDMTLGTLSTVTGQIVVTGAAWTPASGIYGDNFCVIDGYVDVDFGGHVFPASTSNVAIQVGHNSEELFPWEEFHFDTANVPLTTSAFDLSGAPIQPAQFTGPASLNGYDVTVDEDKVLVIESGSSLTPFITTAQQGESDVLLGVFALSNKSHSLDVTMNDITIFDFIGLANAAQPDITNIRVYEYDIVNSSTIGSPLASGLSMGAGNQVTATGMNLFVPRIGTPGYIKHIAIFGDISPSFNTAAGFDVNWEGGSHSPDTDTLIDNNEIHLSLSANGLVNPMTASPAASVPFTYRFNQCNTSVGNPYLNGCWTLPFNRIYNLDMTLGNLIDVMPATSSTLPVTISFDALPSADYSSIITPTGSGFSNAAKVADLEIHNPNVDPMILNELVLSNDDFLGDFSARFGTFYLADDLGNLIDTATLMDIGGAADGTVTFDGFTWNMGSGLYTEFEVYTEVLPIAQAAHSGKWIQLYLSSTNSSHVEILNGNTGNQLLPSEIINNAYDGDTYQQYHVTRRTVPTISYNNGSLTSGITGSVNSKEVYNFTIAASQQGDIDWGKLTFNLYQTPGIQVSNLELYQVGLPTPIATAPGLLANGEVALVPTTPQTIPAGQFSSYSVHANLTVTNPSSSQTASFTLTAADDYNLIMDTFAAVNATNPDFIWSDRSDPGHSVATPDWTNGFLVDIFDVDTVNIGYIGTGGPQFMTRHELLENLFIAKGQSLTHGLICPDTTASQDAVWNTAINLGIIGPYPNGLCDPNSAVNRAVASKVLAEYAINVTGTMPFVNPVTPSFPDIVTGAWYYPYVESMYNAIGNVYAVAGNNFNPANSLLFSDGMAWINNLP